MKKILLIIILFTGFLLAQENAPFAGSFTRLGLGARSISMGNTGVSGPAGGYSFFYNPALAGKNDVKIFSASYNFMSQDRHIAFVGFSMKIPPGAGLSIGWLNSGFGNLFGYNSIGNETGELSHAANAIYATFSRHFSERFSIGVTLKFLMEYISDLPGGDDFSSQGFGGDVGVFYQLSDDISLGAVYKDIGSKLKANTEDLFDLGGTTIDEFPRIFRIGGFYKTPLEWLNFAYDFEASNKKEYRHHFGLEAVHGRNLALRIGLNGDQFVAGTGLDFTLYKYESNLDYAFISSVIDEGSSHLFSWEIYF